ncbi:MAG TPA: hypothetical protein VNS58_07385 [Puia sp.]|nr:hypothetical protein [Puia sp.]
MKQFPGIVLCLLILATACKKSSTTAAPVQTASLTIVNALINSASAIVGSSQGFDQNAYYHSFTVPFGTGLQQTLPVGVSMLTITGESNATAYSYYSSSLALSDSAKYSFFLAGTATVPTILRTTDTIPKYAVSTTDSITGVRFINCSPGSNPISVNVQGSPAQKLVNNLAYMAITPFQTLPVNIANGFSPSIIFEVRDVASDTVLTTYTLNSTLFKNQTLVVAGQETAGAAVPVTVFPVNNF